MAQTNRKPDWAAAARGRVAAACMDPFLAAVGGGP